MANVFFRQNKMDIADSLYSEVTDIWYTHLNRLVDVQIRSAMRSGPVWFDDKDQEGLDENQEAEALQILSAIYDLREQAAKKEPIKIAKVLHALAMLHYVRLDFKAAHELGRKLVQLTQQLPKDDKLDSVMRFIESTERKMSAKQNPFS